MPSLPSFLSLVHLIGLALAVGSATAKLMLLMKSRADQSFLAAYLAGIKSLTRLIVLGTLLLVLSGVGWLLVGYPFTTLLIVKLVMVVAILVLGPVIDNVIEPEFRRLAPAPGETASPAFLRVRHRYLLLEASATGLFYVIIVMWVLF